MKNINSENGKEKQLQNEIRKLKFIIQTREHQIRKLNEKNKKLGTDYENAKADIFSYKNLKEKPKKYSTYAARQLKKIWRINSLPDALFSPN